MKLIRRESLIYLPSVNPTVAGRFRLVATKISGESRVLAEFDNIVTDAGLNRMGIGDFRSWCFVGTGSNAPTATDAQLQTTRARTNSGSPNTPGAGAQSIAPYYTQVNAGFRFSVGSASGNLTEVGIGWSTGGGLNDYQLFARALIRDLSNNPTTVTVLGDEVLDVFYSLRIYPPTVDQTYSVVVGSVTHDCITRAANVTSASNWAVPSNRVFFTSFPGSMPPGVFNGTLGLITQNPSGNAAYNAGVSNAGYSNNSLQQDATLSWGLDAGNVPGGIRSMFYQTSVGAYQTQFTPAIAKDNTKVLSVSFRVGWSRRP